jgi:hypothetical protein
MAHQNRSLLWEIVIVTGVVVVVVALGYSGLNDYYNLRHAKNFPPASILYMTLQLFTLNFSPVDAPDGAELGGPLEVARFAAPLLSSYAVVRALMQIFSDPLKNARVSLLRNHVLVCGLSQKGFALVKDFRLRRVPVVVVEWDKENDLLENCRDLGALLVMGDATEELTLRKAACGRARLLFAVCDEDGVNAEIGMLAQSMVMRESGKAPLEIFLHIENLKLCALLRSHGVSERKAAGSRLRIFNIHENAARFVLKEHPLEGHGIAPDDSRSVHLIVIGFSKMGEMLALHAAEIGHYANGKRLRVTLIDRQMKLRSTPFRARYPQFDQVCEVEYWNEDYEDPKVLECIERCARDETRILTIAVCLAEDGVSLACALRCTELLREVNTRVLVRLDRDSGLAGLAGDSRVLSASRIRTFVVGGSFCSEREIVEKDRTKLARAIYADARSRDNAPHWNELDEESRNFHRQAADHVPVKLRAIDCDIVPAAQAASGKIEFSKTEIELLAQMEHRRWRASRLLAGYRHGITPDGKKDSQRKINPLLVEWQDMPDLEKERARRTVTRIPEWLGMIGKGAQRRRFSAARAHDTLGGHTA